MSRADYRPGVTEPATWGGPSRSIDGWPNRKAMPIFGTSAPSMTRTTKPCTSIAAGRPGATNDALPALQQQHVGGRAEHICPPRHATSLRLSLRSASLLAPLAVNAECGFWASLEALRWYRASTLLTGAICPSFARPQRRLDLSGLTIQQLVRRLRQFPLIGEIRHISRMLAHNAGLAPEIPLVVGQHRSVLLGLPQALKLFCPPLQGVIAGFH